MIGTTMRRTGCGFAAALLGLAAFTSPALSAGPFRPFLGSWRGGGEIVSDNGRREPISCRATYQGAENDSSMTQTLVCASDAFRLNIESRVVASGGALRGEWRETNRNVQGSLSGGVSGGDFRGAVSGAGFTADVSIRASGRRQAVLIRPSAGDIRSVNVSLTKGR